MGVTDRVKTLFAKTKRAPTLSPYSVEHDKLDEFVLGDMRDTSRRFEQALTSPVDIERVDENGQVTSHETYEQATDLRSDLFFAHHVRTDDVRMADRDDVRPSAQLNAEIMRHFVNHPDFLATRPMTRDDAVGSALSTIAAQTVLEEELKTTLKDHAQASQDAAANEEAIRQQEEILAQLREQVRKLRENGDPIPDELKALIKQAAQDKADARKQLGEYVKNGVPGMGGAVAGAVATAAKDAKDLAEVYVSLPGVGIGAGQRIQPEHAIELAYKWRDAPNLKRMTELMVRFERDFRYKRSNRVIGGSDIIVGVETGNDVVKLLPMEFASLGHPILRRKFYRDFAAKQLLQYEMVGEAESAKGPIIICIDASGSMSGDRNEWARAVALSVCSIASREKRAVYCIEFASAVTGEWEFPARGGIDPEVATDFAMSFNGGGTDITESLLKAKQIFEKHPAFKTADVLVITDGSDYIGEDDMELKTYFEQRGVRLQGVVIGMDSTPYTSTVCHDEVSVYDLAAPSGATDRIVQGLT